MSYMLSSREIIIEGLVRHWDAKKIIDDLNQILLPRGYSPIYYFEGTPVANEGGMTIRILLAKPLIHDDGIVIKKILETNNLTRKNPS